MRPRRGEFSNTGRSVVIEAPDDLVPTNPEMAATSLQRHPDRRRKRRPSISQSKFPPRACRWHKANVDPLAAATGTRQDRPLKFAGRADDIESTADHVWKLPHGRNQLDPEFVGALCNGGPQAPEDVRNPYPCHSIPRNGCWSPTPQCCRSPQ